MGRVLSVEQGVKDGSMSGSPGHTSASASSMFEGLIVGMDWTFHSQVFDLAGDCINNQYETYSGRVPSSRWRTSFHYPPTQRG